MRAVLLAAVLTCLSACGDRPTGQPAAKVNDLAITVPEVHLAMAGAPSREAKPALEALIDQELLAQHAVRHRLDRDPEVASALRGARRQILAQAAVSEKVASIPAMDKDAARAFYREHPELFAQRRIYRIFEISLPEADVDLQKLDKKVRVSGSLTEIGDWLRDKSIAFQLGASTKTSEQIPSGILPKLAAMRDGEMLVWQWPSGERVSIIQLIQSQSAAMSEDEALPLIEKQLLAAKQRETVAELLKALRSSARIERVL